METEYQRLLSEVRQAKTEEQGRIAIRALDDYLASEPVSTKLLREASSDEQMYIWYAEQDCETKGYQWYQASQVKYVGFVAYALGSLLGFTVEEITQKMGATQDESLSEEDVLVQDLELLSRLMVETNSEETDE